MWRIIFALVLAGCVSGPSQREIEERQQRKEQFETHYFMFIGKSISTLVAELGAPTQTQELPDKTKVYSYYTNHGNVNLSSGSTYKNPLISSYNSSGFGVSIPRDCLMTFMTDAKGAVMNWNYKGKWCY